MELHLLPRGSRQGDVGFSETIAKLFTLEDINVVADPSFCAAQSPGRADPPSDGCGPLFKVIELKSLASYLTKVTLVTLAARCIL